MEFGEEWGRQPPWRLALTMAVGTRWWGGLSGYRGPSRGWWPKGGLPKELAKLHTLVTRGLIQTAAMWSEVRVAYGWVHRAAHILGNEEGRDAYELRRVYRGMLGVMLANRQ